ncbi:heat shock protein 90-5, chloroplastic [Tanacetum coccineum]
MAPVLSRTLTPSSLQSLPLFTSSKSNSTSTNSINRLCLLKSGLKSSGGLKWKVDKRVGNSVVVRCEASAVAEKESSEAPGETYEYQAEVSRLMNLIVHSLYSHKEIFLRELVSNASDALDKLRFSSVTDPSLLGDAGDLEIRIKPDPELGTITISDTGIGMTREELIDCLGTIAQSGTSKFLNALKDNKDLGNDNSLIGQFGVGFYSAFLVADKVSVSTKSPRSDKQYVWEAAADSSSYVIREETDPAKQISRGTEITLYLRGEVEFRSVIYIPGMAPMNNEDVVNPMTKNIRLYVKRVFISDDFDGELFPRYLSFVKGVVDSNDLPLNVSREILQESRIVRIMRKRLVRKTFDMIQELADSENKEDYRKFWENFGKFVKLGCIEDTGNHKRITPLLRFFSSKSEDELISLDQYIDNMDEKQNAIYYIATDSLQSAKSAPFLEKLVQKDIEVPDLENLDLDHKCLGDTDEARERENQQEYVLLCDWMKQQLGDKVAKVQISNRLSSSPCVLVSGKFGWSANMERLMRAQTLGDTSTLEFMRGRRIMEVNPDHPIIKDLNAACKNAPDSTEARRAVDLLYETSLISSGFTPDSPAELGSKIYEMMAVALGGRWGRVEESETAEPTEDATSEATDTEVVEPSEVRTEADPWST